MIESTTSREAKNAATMEALASAMSRSRPKETTLDYQAKPGQEDGRQRIERAGDQAHNAERAEREYKWKESLSQVERAVAAREKAAETKQFNQDTERAYER